MSEARYQKVCHRNQIPAGGIRNFTIDGREIALFDTENGLVARSGVCKHNGYKFELCERNGDVIRCPLHHWQYRISTGKGIQPKWTQLERYPLEIRGDEVWVCLEPEADDDETFDTSSYNW